MHAQEAVVVRLQKSRNVQSSDPRAWALLSLLGLCWHTSGPQMRPRESPNLDDMSQTLFDEGEIRADDAELLEQGMHVWLCDAHDGVIGEALG